MAAVVVAWSHGPAFAAEGKGKAATEQAAQAEPMTTRDQVSKKLGKKTEAEQKAAAQRARQQGMLPGVAGTAPGAADAQPANPRVTPAP